MAELPRLPFIVNTFDKSTGAGQQLRIWAHSEEEAVTLIGPGKVSQAVFIEPALVVHLADDSLPPSHGPIVTELRAIGHTLTDVRRCRSLNYPIGSIAWGVIIGLFAFALIGAILGGIFIFPRIPVR